MTGFWRLLARIRPYRHYLILAIGFNILLSVFTVISIPIIIPFFQVLFDKIPPVTTLAADPTATDYLNFYFSRLIEGQGKEHALLWVCGLILVVFLLKNVCRYLSVYFMSPLRNGLLKNLRGELFEKYLKLPLSFFYKNKKGDLLSRLTADVYEVEYSILNVVESVFKDPLIIIGAIGYMIWESPSMTLFVFVLLAFVTIIIGGISRTLKSKSHEVQGLVSKLNVIAEEALGGIRVIKSFRAESHVSKSYQHVNKAHTSGLTRIQRRRDLSSPLSEFLGIATVSALLWYGAQHVFSGDLSAESFFAFLFAFFQVIEPSKSLSKAYYNIQKGMASVERIDEFLQSEQEDYDTPSPSIAFDKDIVFKNVSFSYPDSNIQALQDVSFTVHKGEKIAIIGASGAGKSTLIDLLAGLLPLTSGDILIDGKSTKEIPLQALRSLFAMVSQHIVLFNESISSNIDFGLGAKLEDIRQAAKESYADIFINELPDQYDHQIGDRGEQLSGGQRQRLAIARAILRRAPILLLDEATSALDTQSEQFVQKSFDQLIHQGTAIIIAHRLSTIRDADKIIVLDKGQIIETGDHQTLMAQNGLYRKFVKVQTIA